MRRVLAVAFAALCCGNALAQAADTTIETEDSTFRCLEVNSKGQQPAYPEDALKRRFVAVVRVRLTFVAPDKAPDADVFFSDFSDDKSFVESVKAYVKAYRLPCMQPGRPVAATQEFIFTPRDGRPVYSGSLLLDGENPKKFACLVRGPNKLKYSKSGSVIAEIKALSRDKEPEIRILYNSGPAFLVEEVRAYLLTSRIACEDEVLARATIRQKVTFKYEGERTYVLRDVDLPQLVRMSKNWQAKPAYFDLNTMNCPFELDVSIYQPYGRNGVGQVERVDPNRNEFINWLKGLEFEFSADAKPDLLGTSTRVKVPCVVLDLT